MENEGLVGGSVVPDLEWSVGNACLVGGSAVPDLEWTGGWSVGNAGLVGRSVVPDLERTGDWSVGLVAWWVGRPYLISSRPGLVCGERKLGGWVGRT